MQRSAGEPLPPDLDTRPETDFVDGRFYTGEMHAALRNLVNRGFTPQRVAAYEGHVPVRFAPAPLAG